MIERMALISKGARALSDQPDLENALGVFVDFWGLDCYTPPEEVERTVRDLVQAFLLDARALRDGGE